MPIATIASTIAALRGSIELAKNAIETMDKLKMAEAQQAMNDRVIDVQNAALDLQERQSAARDEIDELKDDLRKAKGKIAELELAQAERENYELFAIRQGAFVYRSRPDGSEAPTHCICQSCFDGPEKRRSVLVHKPGYPGGGMVPRVPASWSCPVCKHVISEP